jgi:hypothetical protein
VDPTRVEVGAEGKVTSENMYPSGLESSARQRIGSSTFPALA